MMWEELKFTINSNSGHQKPYQEKFFEILTHESASNFVYTRELTLHFSMGPVTLSDLSQCTAIKCTVDKLVTVFEYAAPYLCRLNLKIEPFIPTDCGSNELLWPILNSCNDAIYYCLGIIANRETDFPIFYAEIGRDTWAFDVEYRRHLRQILRLLAPRITILQICESPYFLNDWLPLMRRMKALRLRNVGSANTEHAGAMWTAIAELPISQLNLNGFIFPSDISRYISNTLTEVFLIGVDDVVAACVVFFSQLPHLTKCALNWGKEKNPETDRSVVIKDTVCTKLLRVYFVDSVVPLGLISVIAKKNRQLIYVTAPPNISDTDIINLRKFCPRLRDISMSNGPLDLLRLTVRITKVGLAEIQHMRALQCLTLPHRDVCIFEEEFLFAIAKNCSLLHMLEFWIPNEHIGNWTETDIRACLVGSDAFKDHVLSVAEIGSREWSIPLATFRIAA